MNGRKNETPEAETTTEYQRTRTQMRTEITAEQELRLI